MEKQKFIPSASESKKAPSSDISSESRRNFLMWAGVASVSAIIPGFLGCTVDCGCTDGTDCDHEAEGCAEGCANEYTSECCEEAEGCAEGCNENYREECFCDDTEGCNDIYEDCYCTDSPEGVFGAEEEDLDQFDSCICLDGPEACGPPIAEICFCEND